MESMLFWESRRLKACCAGELTGRQLVGIFRAVTTLDLGNARIDDYLR